MGKLLSYLFSPKKLLNAIREHKVQITGFFVLLFAALLTFFTVMPIFGIVLVKILMTGKQFPWTAVWTAFKITALLLLFIPAIKWWGQSLMIRLCLRSEVHKEQLPSFSIVLLARSMGLLPMILLLPLKVLLLPPKDIIGHIFFPPISAMLVTGLDSIFAFSTGTFWDFFTLTKTTSYARPSFAISAFLLGLTFLLTVRKVRQLSGLPAGFVFSRVLFAVLLWDVFSLCFLLAFPSLM